MIRTADVKDVQHVLAHLRSRDREEIEAMHWGDIRPAVMAAEMAGAFAFTTHADDGEPTAVCCAVPWWPGVWVVGSFGTERWNETVASLTKFVRRDMIPALVRGGAHRAHCYSLSTYTDAHRWIEALGAKREAELRQFGRHGEDFISFRWLASELNVQGAQSPQAHSSATSATAG